MSLLPYFFQNEVLYEERRQQRLFISQQTLLFELSEYISMQ